MQISSMSPRFLVVIVLLLSFAEARAQSAQSQQPQKYEPAGLNAPPPQPDLFEASLGFNYIYLGDAHPATRNMYGVETSLFVNATSWLAVGGDFMANFGSHSIPFFRSTIDVDSQRYVYVFGPRVTVWRSPQFRLFLEALGGGVHAGADVTVQSRFVSATRSASADAFAMALGGGFDWRFSNHLAWRIVQADYLPTNLDSQWQNNFRASTSIVYSFGRP
jgi:hypothetical protein